MTTAKPDDGRRVLGVVLAAQGLRGVGYGLAAVQLGAILRGQGLDARRVGLLLAAIVAGSAATSLALGRVGDRLGRARAYRLLYGALALAGTVLALDGPAWLLALVALSGALSTEVVESGPFTTLEQVMLAATHAPQAQITRGFGLYNAVATLAGAAGALLGTLPADPRLLGGTLVVVGVAGALLATRLPPTAEVEAPRPYVPADQVLEVAARESGRSFDAPSAEFTHQGGKCTFEVLIDHFQLGGDPALVRLARIVHAGDLDSDPLGPGLLAIGEGGLDAEAGDQRLLEKGSFVYDALYAWCQRHLDQPAPA